MRGVRSGQSQRRVATQAGVSLGKVQWWLERAGDQRLDRVDFGTRKTGRASNRTPGAIEDLILEVRRELKEQSDLGEYGDVAIREELQRRELEHVPSTRTIGRILERRGALDGRIRRRHPAPPRGWYLPQVAAGNAEIDSFDLIEDLRIEKGPLVDVLTGISVLGSLGQAWPVEAQARAQWTMDRLLEHWREVGIPNFAQFDNDTRFQGAHQHRDVISRVMRLCLGLQVTPVFAPPREYGFQASIEAFNGQWQRSVWARFHHASLNELQWRSANYIAAHRRRHAARADGAPARRPFPRNWNLDLQAHPTGCVIFLRRTNEHGALSLLGRSFPVASNWPHRLVRCEVHLTQGWIRFFALRRREPRYQPLVGEIPYALPRRRFQE